ncbi:MAG: hypothetical protein K2X48_15365 [Chitinophagaceae bacterium]|nr:hypothetical protein [Chitinophagaceae bacterium]
METPQSQQTLKSQPPVLENGVLKFTDFRSFRFYGRSKVLAQPVSSVGARTNEPFISMKTAFDSITKADAVIAEQLAQQYPNGPASVFDNPHTPLVTTFPNSIYIAGNAAEGFYYESNSFDKAVTPAINKDGFVIVDTWLLQYSKDSLKMWLVGNNGVNGRLASTVYFSAKMKDKASVESMRLKFNEHQQKNFAAKTFLDWTAIPEDYRTNDCQQTVRINGKNRRIIGRIYNNRYFNPSNSTQYESTTQNQTRSLTGRAFGTWYDNWSTEHHQFYGSTGPIQTVYPVTSYNDQPPYSFNINSSYNFNWTWNSEARSRTVETDWIVLTPLNSTISSGFISFPMSIVTIGSKPTITGYSTHYRAYDPGFASWPNCSCAISF